MDIINNYVRKKIHLLNSLDAVYKHIQHKPRQQHYQQELIETTSGCNTHNRLYHSRSLHPEHFDSLVHINDSLISHPFQQDAQGHEHAWPSNSGTEKIEHQKHFNEIWKKLAESLKWQTYSQPSLDCQGAPSGSGAS